MARSEQKRQKKLQAKKLHRKDKQKTMARLYSGGMNLKLNMASDWPIVESSITTDLWELGIGQVLLARRGPNGKSAVVIWLVDVYCLGVKDVILCMDSHASIHSRISSYKQRRAWKNVAPEYARKLVEDSISYARSLGLEPHDDCAVSQLIFGEIDSSACTEVFSFGKNGRPNYISGPYDSPAFMNQIIMKLHVSRGIDNFDFTRVIRVTDGLLDDVPEYDDETVEEYDDDSFDEDGNEQTPSDNSILIRRADALTISRSA